MRIASFLFVFLISFSVFSQLKQVKKSEERYYVLKSDPSVKHGLYKAYEHKELKLEGYYDNGLETGLWKFYDYGDLESTVNYVNGKKHGSFTGYNYNEKVIETGWYLDGEKDSVWTLYEANGSVAKKEFYKKGAKTGIAEYYFRDSLEQRYNFSTGDMLWFKPDTSSYTFLLEGDTLKATLDQPPLYLGGKREMRWMLVENMHYPQEAVESEISAKVVVEFTVNPDGSLSDVHVEEKKGYGLDEEAIRVIQEHAVFVPGKYKGQKVKTFMRIPITFKLA